MLVLVLLLAASLLILRLGISAKNLSKSDGHYYIIHMLWTSCIYFCCSMSLHLHGNVGLVNAALVHLLCLLWMYHLTWVLWLILWFI
jgi:hypothetical protein